MGRIPPSTVAVVATVILIVAGAIGYSLSHITIDAWFVLKVFIASAALQLLNIRYYKQQEWPLIAAIHGATLLAIFTTMYSVTHYTLPEHSTHFWDAEFAAFDAFFGVTADDIVPAVRSVPILDEILKKIYYAFFFHFALFVPYAAGVRKNPVRMYEGLAQMFVAAIYGLILFGLFPAKNAVWFYGHEDIHHTRMIVEHLQLLQDHAFGTLTAENTEGLIQFPSFHVAIAAILCWDLRYENRWVFRLGIVWGFLMAVSAITTGGHYVIDIWGGLFIAVAAVVTLRVLGKEPILGWNLPRPIDNDTLSPNQRNEEP